MTIELIISSLDLDVIMRNRCLPFPFSLLLSPSLSVSPENRLRLIPRLRPTSESTPFRDRSFDSLTFSWLETRIKA